MTDQQLTPDSSQQVRGQATCRHHPTYGVMHSINCREQASEMLLAERIFFGRAETTILVNGRPSCTYSLDELAAFAAGRAIRNEEDETC